MKSKRAISEYPLCDSCHSLIAGMIRHALMLEKPDSLHAVIRPQIAKLNAWTAALLRVSDKLLVSRMPPESRGHYEFCLARRIQIIHKPRQLRVERLVVKVIAGAILNKSQDYQVCSEIAGKGVFLQKLTAVFVASLPIRHLTNAEGGIGMSLSDLALYDMDVILFLG